MPRPPRPRNIAGMPAVTYFKPAGVPLSALSEVVLTVDQLEALRLADGAGMYQDEAATQMGVSRATFGRIVAEARRNVAVALCSGMAIRVEGGPVMVPPGPPMMPPGPPGPGMGRGRHGRGGGGRGGGGGGGRGRRGRGGGGGGPR